MIDHHTKQQTGMSPTGYNTADSGAKLADSTILVHKHLPRQYWYADIDGGHTVNKIPQPWSDHVVVDTGYFD